MLAKKHIKIYVAGLLFPMAILASLQSLEAQVAVIAHRAVPVSHIDHDELLDLYSGEIYSWDDGSEVVVLDLKTRNDTRKRFYEYLGKSPSRIKSIWIKKKLSGEGNPPEAFETDQELIDKVISTPGSIAFVSGSMTSTSDNFKTLMIIQQ